MEQLLKWLRHYLSPVFMMLLVVSFIFWYIAKLNHVYTTEQVMQINVSGRQFPVTCEVEGLGTKLFGYRVYNDKPLRIPLSELRVASSEEGRLAIDPSSLQHAISMRCTDFRVLSIGEVPEIDEPEN